MIGKQLGNRYEILERLGGGGMAVVYKGRDTFLNRLVTIKILRPEFSSDKDFTRRFRREAQAVASLSHPNIVSIYDVGQEGDIQYLVMEYVDGEDLKTIIRREGTLPPEKAVQIAYQILEALEHAHENNIVHRDIKPHNILITKGGWAKLTDFGIAREASTATITQTDTIVGSVHYISPEQARGELAGPRSDLYSLGVVLYEMLTGSVPFSGDSPIAVAIKHIQEEPEPPSHRNPAISPALEQIVMRAMQKNPELRFGSAREMARRLENLFASSGEEATRFIPLDDMATRVLQPVEKKPHRRRLRTAGWVSLALLLLVLLAGGLYALSDYLKGPPPVTVPSVVNKKLSEAQKILTDLGFQVRVREEHHPEIPEGYVIEQDIGPDDGPVKPPRDITLTVSLGPDLREVPDLYRLSLEDARLRLVERGLVLSEQVLKDYNDDVPPDLIFQQSPVAGERVAPGTAVKVYLSLGPKPKESRVPNLIGLTLEQARAKLAENNLGLDENVEWVESTRYFQNQVIDQEPEPDSLVTQGSVVKITLSKGPGPVPGEAQVKVPLENDGQTHQVKIVVNDVRGTTLAYVNTHQPGETVITTVRYYGQATIQIYIDNKLVKQKSLKEGEKNDDD
ncbi:Stk1 family PASTA domain-containing Ser/Thr kinase [Desulfofundulus thermocisternus]|uniref:Stk1 family PASTA domain-containing Ser/Thr kinase n=1 Tax=Desulfofundulus thermocisternus TaxID=42471 RepID=UPI00217E2F52|nr:Stk1 family PASTA domain-containing Ser/Thr kinase [Desulfofundulus thermocisternus]MCS5695955.1 Stk1 family PASTA domain-containing Ser/Thr kinase [Desulfofundulus thermocisternus]